MTNTTSTENPGLSPLLKSLNLITSSKSLLPYKVTFTNSRDYGLNILGDHYSTYHTMLLTTALCSFNFLNSSWRMLSLSLFYRLED